MMEMTGEPEGAPQVLGIPLPDMGTSEHAYGQLMKALYLREATGEGTCINLSMFESSLSWLTVPITFTASFHKKSTRRGNTHEFFCPVSVYRTSDGFVYLAVGNDRQWQSLVSQDLFKSLNKPEYEKNAGRIADVGRLNQLIEEITVKQKAEDLIQLFKSITLPASKINSLTDVVADPLVARRLLFSEDEKTGTKITLAPPPYLTPWIEDSDRYLSFPPRFGEHNETFYGRRLGYDGKTLAEFKERNII